MEIASIWDGWEKQCFGTFAGNDGKTCARGWVMNARRTDGKYHIDYDREDLPEVRETYARVARRIIEEYGGVEILPDPCSTPYRFGEYVDRYPAHVLVAVANNELRLTPEDFRRIDRETQLAALESLVESATEPELVEV